jgi:hypothetical protein
VWPRADPIVLNLQESILYQFNLFPRVLYILVILFVTQDSSYGTGKGGGKKRREEVHSRRGAIPGEFGEGGSTVNVSGKRLSRHSAQASTEDPDLGGDTGTSSDDNVEDETFPGQYELRRHQEAGSDDDDSDEAADEEDEKEDVDAMDEDDDDQGRFKIMPPTYTYPDRPVKYHGASMTKALKKLRDRNPYEEARTASDPRFWAKFQQDYYATVIIKKPKITHKAQYVDWEHMARKSDPIFDEVINNCEAKDQGTYGVPTGLEQGDYSPVLSHSAL